MGASTPEKQDLMAYKAFVMNFMPSIQGIEVILRQCSLQSLLAIEAVKISIISLIGAELYFNYTWNKYIYKIPIAYL